MNILELEEGLRNLIVTQPAILNSENGAVINSIKNIIESHKAFLYAVEEYPENDILKVGIINESSKLELNLTSYICQILQERGINIMLYVPKFAAVYNTEIRKYVDDVKPAVESVDEKPEESEKRTEEKEDSDEKYMIVEQNEKSEEKENNSEKIEVKIEEKLEKNEKQIKTQAKGRDYLMELLKK